MNNSGKFVFNYKYNFVFRTVYSVFIFFLGAENLPAVLADFINRNVPDCNSVCVIRTVFC